jgi:hypothetical protein
MCMSVSRVSVFIYFPAVIFISMSEFSTIHFRDISMRRIVTAIFLVWVWWHSYVNAVITFAFGFATTPLVLLCLGRGGFCFRFAARYICACALIGLHFPNFTTAQYLFQYMISFFLRSRYSFIFKGTKSLFICGYVPLCSLRRVLWVLLMLLGDGLLPAHCAVLAHLA